MPNVTTLSLYASLNIKNVSYLDSQQLYFNLYGGGTFHLLKCQRKQLKSHKQLSAILNHKQPSYLFKNTA